MQISCKHIGREKCKYHVKICVNIMYKYVQISCKHIGRERWLWRKWVCHCQVQEKQHKLDKLTSTSGVGGNLNRQTPLAKRGHLTHVNVYSINFT